MKTLDPRENLYSSLRNLLANLCLIGVTLSGPSNILSSYEPTPTPDARILSLNRFFASNDCPAPFYSIQYLDAADKYDLDYRLLPAISVLESACGKHACDDGIRRWGYGNCKGYTFDSVAEGIDYVSENLANGLYYRGKTIPEKLKMYNPNRRYGPKVEALMRAIEP